MKQNKIIAPAIITFIMVCLYAGTSDSFSHKIVACCCSLGVGGRRIRHVLGESKRDKEWRRR